MSQVCGQYDVLPNGVQIMNDKQCTVCGYEMDEGPRSFNICPSCGTEFGLHDENASTLELRDAWLASGPKWYSPVIPKPLAWKPIDQLMSLFLNAHGMAGAIVITSPKGVATRIHTFGLFTKRRRRRSTVPSNIHLGNWAPKGEQLETV